MPRGLGSLATKTEYLITEATTVLAVQQPTTLRGVAYKLFDLEVIPDMSRSSVNRVGRALVIARERGMIPCSWIVDEHRELERSPAWSDPDDFANVVRSSYCRDRWLHQPCRVMLVSEKGTVRGKLKPIIDHYGLDFLAVHGFSSATVAHDLAVRSRDPKPLVCLYVGDFDPSGKYMSDADLPQRVERYGGNLQIERIALVESDLPNLVSHPTIDKKKDPRFQWYLERFGDRFYEVDALDANDLRTRVERAVLDRIDVDVWEAIGATEDVELDSLTDVLSTWKDLRILSDTIENMEAR
jgi:hypothetical protein